MHVTLHAGTVTASAIPSEKLRPCHPLVAMPRIGYLDSKTALPIRLGIPG